MEIETPPTPGAEIEETAETLRIKRNQHLKIDDPKKHQFTARANQADADIINAALTARERATGRKHDIVTLSIAMIKNIEADILQTFKTK
jgi:16S rRNA U1498 N3-methylase RsmE